MFTARFDEALKFASYLHRTQIRKGTDIPYISHLLAVAALVIEDGGSEDEAIAALLHDAIEDQGAHYPGGRNALREHIAQYFGESVLHIVDGCTDDDAVSETEKRDPAKWRPRKERYLRHLRERADAAVRRVSCADKLHNARSLLANCRGCSSPESVWGRFRTRSKEDQLWYYGELVRVFNDTRTGALAEELARVAAQLQAECRA